MTRTRQEILSDLDATARDRVAALLARPEQLGRPAETLAGALGIVAEEANRARKPHCSCGTHLHAHYPFSRRCTAGGDATAASVEVARSLKPDYALADEAEAAGY